MAVTFRQRVGDALELFNRGVQPFIERELEARFGARWEEEARRAVDRGGEWVSASAGGSDTAALINVLIYHWEAVFKLTLSPTQRAYAFEVRDARNAWAHQKPVSSDDAYRALDSIQRFLEAVSAPQAAEVDAAKQELLRVRFEEQVRTERRRSAGTAIDRPASGGLKPWREVVTPHDDVASGRYQQAEFAADLWQVHLGEGGDEYRDPVEFFRRTYLTESLKRLLVGAVQRLAGRGGDPVVQLQTNFGGGKTHSMLALYHLFSGLAPGELLGIEAVLRDAGMERLPAVKQRVVLVGNKLSPGNPSVKADGAVVHTLWGELAWQLGGRAAYDRLRADDERATSPGDVLRELLNEYGPCLILIDEWVAYARQLHDDPDLPGGSFETHFTFAQALTEAAKASRQGLVVISLPASDTAGSPHARADDVEVGGERGRAALDRLRNVVGRVESSWRPASAEESFEIVRRRLFEPLVEREQFVARDMVAKAFADLYRTQQQEFPPECREADYEKRLKAAYPIHPEVFDRLYTDWSTLVKFQRTRGVLRLMAAVIHSLWAAGDRYPLILPCSLPIDDPQVQFELTRYLSDNWVPVLEKDVDGPSAVPLRLDGEVPNLGRFAACRRVARTIYLGSAPTATAANRGIEDRRVKLGCVIPGESPAVFGDALRRLSAAATYLYQDGPRYWYSTQPTVTKLADDRAEQLRQNPDKIAFEVERRVRKDVERKGDFSRVHPLPQSGGDVPDDNDARLVVLGIDLPYSKEAGSRAAVAAKAILESRGSVPRQRRNTLVFLAVDQARLQDLDAAVRLYLAWESILAEKEALDLSPHQVKQAETQRSAADGTVSARLPEAYQWLLVPVQETPQSEVELQAFRLTGQDALAVRACKKLCNDELLVTSLVGTRLRMELDRVPLWRGDHVAIRQLVEDFASYLYLPRLRDPTVLADAVSSGLAVLSWELDTFAYADSYDEAEQRYRGLRSGQRVQIADGDTGLLVKAEVAVRQQEAERLARQTPTPGDAGDAATLDTSTTVTPPDSKTGDDLRVPAAKPKRFHGTVNIDPLRAGRDAGQIADEVIAHLVSAVGARVTVTLEIDATVPSGIDDSVVRVVTENSRTLKFSQHGFESA